MAQVYNSNDLSVRTAIAACCLASKAAKLAKEVRFGTQDCCEQKQLALCLAQLETIRYYEIEETSATSMINVTGDNGSDEDTTLVVNAVTISDPFRYTTDDDTTAQAIADAINSLESTPNYSAVASGSNVVITSVTEGATPNGYTVTLAAATTPDITMTAEIFHGGQDGVEAGDNFITQAQLDSMFNNIMEFTGCCLAPLGYNYKTAASTTPVYVPVNLNSGVILTLNNGTTPIQLSKTKLTQNS